MKRLFIYYSLSGNEDLVAEKLKEKDFVIRKVDTVKRMPKRIFPLMMKGGFLAAVKAKTKLQEFDHNIDEFDEVYIGSPIWNGRISSPINTVLSSLNLKNKKITFIFTAGGGEGNKALKRVNKEYPEAKVIFLKEPKKYSDELNKINID